MKGIIMNNEEVFKEHIDCFFKAVKEHTLLIIIDSKSNGSKAVFSLVYYNEKVRRYNTFSYLLKYLGFKTNTDDNFITHCAGRYSLFILDNIGEELKKKNVNLPEWWYKEIQNQNAI